MALNWQEYKLSKSSVPIFKKLIENGQVKQAFRNIVMPKYAYEGFLSLRLLFDFDKIHGEDIPMPHKQETSSFVDELQQKLVSMGTFDKSDNRYLQDDKAVLDLVLRYVAGLHYKELIINKLFVDKAPCQLFSDINSFVWKFIYYYIKGYPKFDGSVFELLTEPTAEGEYIVNGFCKIYRITSLASYFEALSTITDKRCTALKKHSSQEVALNKLFYRGHNNANYILVPSLYRSFDLYDKEAFMCDNMLRRFPERFDQLPQRIDQLSEMQHYRLPTRLLDVSENALIALLFTCIEGDETDGKVIILSVPNIDVRFSHDTEVKALASLSQHTRRDRNNEIISTLSEAINDKEKKAKVKENIHGKQKVLFVTPQLRNQRIIKQSGAFIIVGNYSFSATRKMHKEICAHKLSIEKIEQPIIIVPGGAKKRIIAELQQCDMYESTVYPEMEKEAVRLAKIPFAYK